jgi:sugar phosphate isomerase/epimerase
MSHAKKSRSLSGANSLPSAGGLSDKETMMSSPSALAVQMYTLREFTKTPVQIGQTLRRVKKIGYDAVQLSALGKIDPQELAGMLKDEGLVCCATHVPLERLRDHSDEVIHEHELWECRYTAVGGYFPKSAGREDWVLYAEAFNDIARKYEGSGLRLGYHNHSHELVRYDRKTALQILMETFSRTVWMEIDTYWIQHGGGDPAAWIAKAAGRIPCVHLKDMAIQLDRTQVMAEVGEGNLDWPAILPACRQAGVRWYIVEQDICQGDPFQSLEISLNNLRQMGLR